MTDLEYENASVTPEKPKETSVKKPNTKKVVPKKWRKVKRKAAVPIKGKPKSKDRLKKKKSKTVLPQSIGGRDIPQWVWIAGCLTIVSILGCCMIASIWAWSTRSTNKLFGGRSRFPVEQVKILEETSQSVDVAGGEVSLGNLTIEIPTGIVSEEVTLTVAEVGPKSLLVEPPDNVVGEVYAIEWESGNVSSMEEKITVTFAYDPNELPEDANENEVVITTFDGEEWLQLPTEVDTENNTLSAEVRHFSYFSALWNATSLGYKTTHDVEFRGYVKYTDGRFPGDPKSTTRPAAYVGYGVVDGDGIILHEGFTGSSGAFEFTLAEGRSVGLGLDPFVRVYAESPLAGKVKKTAIFGSGVHTYNSDVMSFVDASTPGDVIMNVEIPIEESGPFKILDTVYWGQITAQWLESNLVLPNPTVIWGGPDHNRYQYTDTGFTTSGDNKNAYIYIGNDPQAAWDEDVILSVYGQYLLYWLNNEERLDCTGRMGEIDQRVSPCYAWVHGFGLYFSALARDDSVYEAYEFEDFNPITYDLAMDTYSEDQRSPGAVAQALWEISNGTTDGTNIEKLFLLTLSHKTSIASLEDLYNFWDTGYSLTNQECLVFAKREIVKPGDCEDKNVQDLGEDVIENETVIKRHTIEYNNQESGSLSFEGRDIWSFQGLANDVISILLLKIDDEINLDMSLIQAWDNRVVESMLIDEDEDFKEWQSKLESEGEYLILVDAVDSQGQYSIYLELQQRWEEDEGDSSEGETSISTTEPDPQIEISYDQTVTGNIFEGDTDWWEFTGEIGDVISIQFWSEDEAFEPYLYFGEDDSGVILMETSTQDFLYEVRIERYSLPETGLYFIGVESVQGNGYYGLKLSLDDGAVDQEEVESTVQPLETGSSTYYEEIDLGSVHHSDGWKSFTFMVPSNFSRVEVGCYDVEKAERSYFQYCGWEGELMLNGDFVYDWEEWNEYAGGIYHNYIIGQDVPTGSIDASGFLEITTMAQPGENEISLDHNTRGDGIGLVIRIYTD